LLADTEVGNGSGYPRAFHEFQGALYFGANGDFWKTDGTSSGTVKIAEPNLTRILNASYNIVSNDDYMLFWGKIDSDKRLWRSDGTTSGTIQIDDQVGPLFGTDPRELTAKDGVIYFVGDLADSGVEVAYSMGEINDAQNISDVQSGTADSDPFSLRACGNKIFFYAEDATNGKELFVADNLTSIEPIQHQQKPEVILMPNPVEDYLIVDIKESYDLPFKHFKILSSNGVIINEGSIFNERLTVNTSQLPSGIYFLELYGDAIRMTKHFVKNKK
jgi:ELWxxDGT repeat protein